MPAHPDVLDPESPSPTSAGRRLLGVRCSDGRALPLAALSVVAAAAHIPVTLEHLQEAFYIGALFIALEVACVVLAVALLLGPRRRVFGAVAGVGALAVSALVVSRTVGLPLIEDDVGAWAEPLAVISLVAESLMVIGGVAAVLRRDARDAWSLRKGLVAGGLILALGGAATMLVATAGSDDAGGHGPATRMRSHHMDGMQMGSPARGVRGGNRPLSR